MSVRAANALWLASCLAGWLRFQRAAGRVEQTQAALLSRYMHTNRETEYGARYHFDSIHSPIEYQGKVPLTSYDDYTDAIQCIAEGRPAVLTAETVRMFELSSGSSAASKLIPYTDNLKAEFQRGLAPWIYNLYTQLPDLQRGPAYWSVTPLTAGMRHTPAGIPIGFESDSAYLSPLGRRLIESVLAVPNAVKYLADVDNFRYATLLHLLRRPGLRLVSVWNPTFLSLLLAPLPGWWECLLEDIARGTLTLPRPAPDPGTELRFTADPQRARALCSLGPAKAGLLWPQLRLVSCWVDGPSAPYARHLQETFPGALLQGKGLLATEAFVSLPLLGVDGSVLAITSHFFEFLNESGDSLLAHEIEQGKAYSVVITTGGGLYRYQLHDLVEVIGHWQQAPCIRFIGKTDHFSDWFGEKLEQHFVAGVFARLFATHRIVPEFALLAPDDARDGFRYVLYLESASCADVSMASELDAMLCENFHYSYCRQLGQLAAARVVHVRDGSNAYLRACQAHGQKLGNIKPGVLQRNTGWVEWFEIISEGASAPEGSA